jgi:hypothetical protein
VSTKIQRTSRPRLETVDRWEKWMGKMDKWYQKTHEKNIKTLEKILKRIKQGFFYVVSIEFVAADRGSHRLTIYLREKE